MNFQKKYFTLHKYSLEKLGFRVESRKMEK